MDFIESNLNVIAVVLLIISVIWARIKNEEMLKEGLYHKPSPQTFAWGFFIGMFSLLLSSMGALLVVYLLIFTEFIMFRFFPLAICIFMIFASLSVIKRRKWALILATILTMNPIIWIINIIYIKNRWTELK